MPKHTIEDLIALIPPPVARPATVDWALIEQRLGFRLPTDYKALADTYGPGVFCDDFLVWTGLPWPDASIEEAGRHAVADLEPLLEDLSIVTWAHDDGTDTAVDLSGDSLFGWGRSTDGDSGYWHRTGDDPDGWPVLSPTASWSATTTAAVWSRTCTTSGPAASRLVRSSPAARHRNG